MTNKKDYKVGYRKPPERTQFKKGASGNPSGRPKRQSVDILAAAIKIMMSNVIVRKNGKTFKAPKILVVLETALNAALNNGNIKALAAALDLVMRFGQSANNQELQEIVSSIEVTFVDGPAKAPMTEDELRAHTKKKRDEPSD